MWNVMHFEKVVVIEWIITILKQAMERIQKLQMYKFSCSDTFLNLFCFIKYWPSH